MHTRHRNGFIHSRQIEQIHSRLRQKRKRHPPLLHQVKRVPCKKTIKTVFLKHIKVLGVIGPYVRHQPCELFRERARAAPGQSRMCVDMGRYVKRRRVQPFNQLKRKWRP